jgi:hypothetical protein
MHPVVRRQRPEARRRRQLVGEARPDHARDAWTRSRWRLQAEKQDALGDAGDLDARLAENLGVPLRPVSQLLHHRVLPAEGPDKATRHGEGVLARRCGPGRQAHAEPERLARSLQGLEGRGQTRLVRLELGEQLVGLLVRLVAHLRRLAELAGEQLVAGAQLLVLGAQLLLPGAELLERRARLGQSLPELAPLAQERGLRFLELVQQQLVEPVLGDQTQPGGAGVPLGTAEHRGEPVHLVLRAVRGGQLEPGARGHVDEPVLEERRGPVEEHDVRDAGRQIGEPAQIELLCLLGARGGQLVQDDRQRGALAGGGASLIGQPQVSRRRGVARQAGLLRGQVGDESTRDGMAKQDIGNSHVDSRSAAVGGKLVRVAAKVIGNELSAVEVHLRQ